jgi:hypothetical protein
MILSLAAQLRGQDRIGRDFVLSAVHLNHMVQMNTSRGAAAATGDEAARRSFLDTAVSHLHMYVRISTNLPSRIV